MRQTLTARTRSVTVALFALTFIGLRLRAEAEEEAPAERASPDEGCRTPIKAYKLGKGPGGLEKLPPERILSERRLGATPLSAAELELLEKVDGKLLALPEGKADTRCYLLELRTSARTASSGAGWSTLDGGSSAGTERCGCPACCRRDTKLRSGRGAEGAPLDRGSPGIAEELLAPRRGRGKDRRPRNKKAADGESTKETLLDHGPPASGLFLAAWREKSPDSLLLLADNPAGDRVLRRPFRSGKLVLVATCGNYERTAEIEVPKYMRTTDIGPEGANPLTPDPVDPPLRHGLDPLEPRENGQLRAGLSIHPGARRREPQGRRLGRDRGVQPHRLEDPRVDQGL